MRIKNKNLSQLPNKSYSCLKLYRLKFLSNLIRLLITPLLQLCFPINNKIIFIGKGSINMSVKQNLCIFAHFDRQKKVHDHVVFYLQKLLDLGCEIIFVSTSLLPNSEQLKVIPYCSRIILRDNQGYDFFSYKVGLDTCVNLKKYDKLILANDSVYGPLFDLQPIFKKMQSQNVDIWAMTDNGQIYYHLQTYFVVFNKKAINSFFFKSFWKELYPYCNKLLVVLAHEIGLSQQAIKAGLNLKAAFSYQDIINYYQSHEPKSIYPSISSLKNLNISHDFWDLLIKEYKFPFIKVLLLKENSFKVNIIEHCKNLISQHSDYDSHLITKHIAPNPNILDNKNITVIIINYNAGKLLTRCVAAVKKQTLAPKKIIIFDNASTDESLSMVSNLYPDLLIINSTTNLGFAAANNQAACYANDCEWLAFLNPDAFPHPNWLEELANASYLYPNCMAFGSKMLAFPDITRLDGTGDEYHVSGIPGRRDHGVILAKGHNQSDEIFSPCAAAALINRHLFLSLHGFDESFFCYSEDVDLGFRIRLTGAECRYVSTAIVEHFGSGIVGKKSNFYIYYGQRNLIWVFFKNMPGLLLCLYLPLHLLINIIAIIKYILQGKTKIILQAKYDALKGLPTIIKKRKQIQKNRKITVWALRRTMRKGLIYLLMRHG